MSARRKRLMPEMNVTPLVDVVLVLLIIFMVVTPQLEAGAAVDLPGAYNPDKTEDNSLTPITVSVSSKGEFFLDRKPVSREELLRQLEQLHHKDKDSPLVLKADRSVRYAEVRSIFKAMQDIGFPGVSLQVIDRQKN